MSALDSNKLHDYLSQSARDGRHVTEQEVAAHFGVEIGAVKKRFGLLTGNVVLLDLGGGEYDCSNVLRCSKAAFDSAGSQGKGNQEYVRGLLAEIDRLKKNNDTMREKLLAAQRGQK
jgi:hypothetical protein